MKISISSSVLYLFFFIAAFSGIVVETSLSTKGLIVVSTFLSIPLVISFVIFRLKFTQSWAFFLMLLVLLLVLSGGLSGALFLVILNILIYMVLMQLPKYRVLAVLNSNVFLIFFLVYIAVTFLISVFVNWSPFSGSPKMFPTERLRLFISEPSYLAMLLVPLFFLVNSNYSRMLFAVVVFATQSYLGFVFFFVIYLVSKKSINIFYYGIFILLFTVYLLSYEIDFFSNSGLIRLVGIKALLDDSFTAFNMIFGSGLGAADELLKPFFNSFGVAQANSFVFGLVYDVGFLGFLLLILSYGLSFRGVLLFLVILLNFGAGHILVPLILYLSQLILERARYENSVRNY